ncbi:MAG TPA: hypothetical protein VJ890_19560 [Vineibacter sp.]|nr:hypothetical protein [Vineibacter sp.]
MVNEALFSQLLSGPRLITCSDERTLAQIAHHRSVTYLRHSVCRFSAAIAPASVGLLRPFVVADGK